MPRPRVARCSRQTGSRAVPCRCPTAPARNERSTYVLKTMSSLFDIARGCLDAATPEDKVDANFAAGEAFGRGELGIPLDGPRPETIRMHGRPARPGMGGTGGRRGEGWGRG